MECSRTAIGSKRQRFYVLITILFVLLSSSGTKAADNAASATQARSLYQHWRKHKQHGYIDYKTTGEHA